MIKENFNQHWEFTHRDPGNAMGALMGMQAEKKFVNLPHDAAVRIPRNPGEPDGSGNGFFHEENYEYKKSFTLRPEDQGKLVFLEFEGIYQNAYVYINNSFAAKHPYGYGNFYVDVTDLVTAAEPNEVKVAVYNGVPSGRWYTGGGIYRDVNLMISERLHLIPDGIHLATVSLEDGYAKIRAQSTVENRTLSPADVSLRVSLIDQDGVTAAEDTIPFTLREGESGTYRQYLYVDAPKTWDAENPYLYTYKAELISGGKVTDTETGTFGIRSLSLDPKHGLRVNGKTVNLKGGCLHHDNGIIGTAEFAHAEEVRVKNLKKAGFNAIRSSHYPMSRRLIEACDKYGLYVMDEFSDVWTTPKVDFDYGLSMSDWWEYDVTNMVNKDYNHPSVILYSIGNEIPETGDRFDAAWGKKLADKLRSLDDSRYIVNSMNLMLSVMNQIPKLLKSMGMGAGQVQGGEINEMMTNLGDAMAKLTTSEFAGNATAQASGQVDITGLNYAAARYEPDGKRYPNRIIMGSETFPEDLDTNWALVEKLPYVIGDFDWTAYDYLGEAGIGKISYAKGQGKASEMSFYTPYPCRAAYCGDINLLGDARPVAFWRQIIWGGRKAPYIAVCPPAHHDETLLKTQWAMTDAVRSWTWKGYEGSPVKVEVYSDADEIELLVNGKSAGRKKVGEEKKDIAYFETVFEPGTIQAISYRNGQRAEEDILKTATDEVHLEAIADEKTIPADGSDLCYAELYLRDENGTLNPDAAAAVKVSVSVEGPGVIQGFGSADPDSEENFFDKTAKTFEGRLRAAVRAEGTGTIKVTFSAEGMADAVVEIEAK